MDARWIIDADSHITEPRDVWTARVPRQYVDRVPHVVRDDEGKDIWVLDGVRISTVGHLAPAGFPGNPYSRPATYEECLPAAYDAAERLAYMDGARIWAQVLYPNVAGFGSQRFLNLGDLELQLACVRAYNDFLHEWTSADAGRLIPVMATPFWNVEETVKEIGRCVELGFPGLLFTGEPMRFGLPPFGDPSWDPLWDTAQEAGLPIHFHIGGGEDSINVQSEARVAQHGWSRATTFTTVDLYMKNGVQCTDLMLSGVLERYPELKFVSVESGVGWIPFVLEAADYTVMTHPQHRQDGDLLPSELFRRQIYSTMWFEQVAPANLIDQLPVDNIMFETDFPHISCLYENIQETIDTSFAPVADEIRDKVIWGNAARLYGVEGPAGDAAVAAA